MRPNLGSSQCRDVEKETDLFDFRSKSIDHAEILVVLEES